jgi:hypothetical protein
MRTINIIIYLLVVLASLQYANIAEAQNKYFSKKYAWTKLTGTFVYPDIMTDTSFCAAATIKKEQKSPNYIVAAIVNLKGDTLKSKIIQSDYWHTQVSSVVCDPVRQRCYLGVTAGNDEDIRQVAMVIELNYNLDSLSTLIFEDFDEKKNNLVSVCYDLEIDEAHAIYLSKTAWVKYAMGDSGRRSIAKIDTNFSVVYDTLYDYIAENPHRDNYFHLLNLGGGLLLASGGANYVHNLSWLNKGDILVEIIKTATGDIAKSAIFNFHNGDRMAAASNPYIDEEGNFYFTTLHTNSPATNSENHHTGRLKLDRELNLVWYKDSLCSNCVPVFGEGLLKNKTGYMVYAAISHGDSKAKESIVLMKTDSTGKKIAHRHIWYDGNNKYSTRAEESIYELSDGSLLFIGWVWFVNGGDEDGYYMGVIHTNCMGLLTEPKASYEIAQNEGLTLKLKNTSQYVYPDSIDGGFYVVDWGDGSKDTITTDKEPTLIHTYAQYGTYDVVLYGWVCNDLSVYGQPLGIWPVGINSPPWGGEGGDSPSVRGLGGVPPSEGLGGVTTNPAHQTATITLNPNYTHLIQQGESLEIFNTQGQLVKTVPLSSGGETTTFTTANLISGIYYCRLQNHPEIEGVKMVVW